MTAWLLLGILLGAALLLALLAFRVVHSRSGGSPEPWHLYSPDELDAAALDRTDWAGYLAAEDRLLAELDERIAEWPAADGRQPINRYAKGSPVHAASLARNWNRSFVLEPEGPARGVAVLLHGLTDSPYSLRHVAEAYRERGFVALAIRLPGHGTTPAALARSGWRDWTAAARLAVREARRRTGGTLPLHLVGYSNGATLALDHALAALADPGLEQPSQLVLLSPMVGVTAAARFAGIAGWPAIVPRWTRTAWITLAPEFNPFKYNSFPVRAARESWRATRNLRGRLVRHQKAGRLTALAPVLTFQSVVDSTVLTDAVIHGLHARLAPGRSELVLFDINRAASLGHLLRPIAARDPWSLLPPAPRGFAVTVVGNAGPGALEAVARTVPAGASEATSRKLDLAFPADVHSLSHVALPFPPGDSLYGLDPDPPGAFGLSLGALASRGERNILAVPADDLMRLTANPFFPWLVQRVMATLSPPTDRDGFQGVAGDRI